MRYTLFTANKNGIFGRDQKNKNKTKMCNNNNQFMHNQVIMLLLQC